MKRWLVVCLVAGAMALLPTAAAAADEQQGDGQGSHFGPYSSASTDSGTCGPDWAQDTFKREFTVQRTGAGTWRVRESFIDGHFVTLASSSPGACQGSTPHGLLITAGNKGSFHGYLSGTVTGGTFNPNGCDAAAACTTTTGFVQAVFGPSAQYSCVSGVGACSFFFTYHAHGEDLLFRHWVNASTDLGGNRGDIATS